MMAAFAPGKWGWSIAWLFIAHLFGWYLSAKCRRVRIAKGERVAHALPLPVVDHGIRMPVVLSVRLISATLLRAALKEGGLSDPYVKVTVQVPGQEPNMKRTATKFKSKNPKWDEKFEFQIAEVHMARFVTVTFNLMDEDLLTADDELGFVAMQPD